jgi:hypothetical protein
MELLVTTLHWQDSRNPEMWEGSPRVSGKNHRTAQLSKSVARDGLHVLGWGEMPLLCISPHLLTENACEQKIRGQEME